MSPPITRREEALKQKWDGVDERVSLDSVQFSFDTEARQAKFVEDQFPDTESRNRYDAYREEWHRRGTLMDAGDEPLAVTCELVSSCNLGCSMCYTITEQFQGAVVGATRMLPWPVVKAVIDEAAALDVPSMLFSWRGESTLYKGRAEDGSVVTVADVLSYARRAGILEITMLTHGQLIDEALAAAIVEAQPNWISFSVDGLGEAYNKIRTPPSSAGKGGDAFAEVTANIARIRDLRDAAGQRLPRLRCNTIYPPISRDPEAYHRKMAELGVDWVTVNQLVDFRAEDLPDDQILPDWACQYPFQRLTVAANGTLLPCTGANKEDAALSLGRYRGAPEKRVRRNGRAETVPAPEMTLHEAWHSKKLEGIRKMHRDGRRTAIDPGCRTCRHGTVKRGAEWVPEDWDMDRMEWVGGTWHE